RGAAAGGEVGCATGDRLHRRAHQPGPVPRLGAEGVTAHMDILLHAAGDGGQFLLDPGGEALRRVQVVVADVETGGDAGRDDVAGRVADVDGGDLQGGRREEFRALVQPPCGEAGQR